MKIVFSNLVKASVMGACVALLSVSAEAQHTQMGKDMETVSDNLKSLRKIPKDDFKAGAEAVRAARAAIYSSMNEVPEMIDYWKEGPKKDISKADSSRLMALSYAALCELEIAYLEEDPAKIKEVMKKIKAVKKEGHEKYSDD
ncbi:hypothetical protein [Rubritalea marina]|uniref:hypothetical protein n=1 Tax=Rubritalea marina TaxID=361055 RepID=UPI0003666166|nr:hypothetical protein [Rubritalea marina]